MSKARSMYAGSSGSNYGVNKNSPGNGNGKWQGLWPSVGHARNARHINIEAGGNNRNVVFCMNQLGGVGRISNMFATTADGVQDCKDGQAVLHGGNFTTTGGVTLGVRKNVTIKWNIKDANDDTYVNNVQIPFESGSLKLSVDEDDGAQVNLRKYEGSSIPGSKGYFIEIMLSCLWDFGVFTLVASEVPQGSSTPVETKYGIEVYTENGSKKWKFLTFPSPTDPDPLMWRGVNNGDIGSLGGAEISEC